MLRKIFEPITVNKLTLPNRMVVSAMVTQYCGTDGLPTEKWIQYLEHKARGGWGIIFTENYGVTEHANSFARQAGLWCDEQIPAHAEMVRRVHAAGGVLGCQIYHAGRQTTMRVQGVQPVGPSAIREASCTDTPRELTNEEVWELIERFGDTARRAKECGFDMVEVHGGHGYLINQFLSPEANKRFDEFGGTIENRAKFMVEIIKNVRKKVGPDFPISYRLGTCDYVPGGITLEESQIFARMAVEAGADMIHCTQGMYVSRHTLIAPAAVPKAAFVNNAWAIKQVVDVPVVATGRINDPVMAESILLQGKADMCTMARSSLADPEMPNKAKEGRFEDIIHCIGCCQGCTGENGRGNQIRCVVNPLTGMEFTYDLSKVSEPKNVYIAGGGVAGCEAAIVAAKRGHKVTLFEKSDRLGGQWIAASVPPCKEEYDSFLYWQQVQINKLGIEVKLNTELTREMVEAGKPDTVIVTTGSTPLLPPIPGLRGNPLVVPAIDVLTGKYPVDIGKNILVAGGGLVGAETAEHLSVHGAKNVVVVEMLPDIMVDGEKSPKKMILDSYKEYGVEVHTSTKVEEVTDSSVIVSSVDDPEEKHEFKGLDLVVMALGVKPYAPLAEELKDCGCKVIVAGDAESGKNGYKNIQQGFEAGMNA